MVEQIKNAKFVNSININSRETIYFAHKDYDITLDGIIFRMESSRRTKNWHEDQKRAMIAETEEEALEILAELQEEALAEIAKKSDIINLQPNLVDDNFEAQKKYILDPAPRKGVLCTRRAGKSNGFGRRMYKSCYDFQGSDQLYFGLTRTSAKLIMWDPIIKALDRDLRLGCEFNESELIARIPSGGKIILAGADAKHAEIEKKLGGKFRDIILDEAGSFRQNLRHIIYEMMEPAVTDWEGCVTMGGTPTEITQGLFYDVTTGKEPGWSLHEWDTTDNPYMRIKHLKKIAWIINKNPRIIETPAFRRMYKKEWVIDKESKCYKYEIGLNDAEEIDLREQWTYVLGIDLGFDDSSAFVVSAFNEFDRNLYFIEAYKKSGMIISDVALRIQYYIDKYKPMACVIDNAAKQSVEELKQRYNLPLEAADKRGKAEFIEIMNSEFILGYIKLLPEAQPLAKEYGALIWDEKVKPKREEHPACENHICDAALYNWRKCFPYLATQKPKKKTDEEKIDEWFDLRAANMSEEAKLPFWER
jgi:hypothetical protein